MLLPVPQQKPPRLSEELLALRDRFQGRKVHLRSVIRILRGRAYTLLLILLALPFVTPIPLPGLSTLFGLVIALIALRLVLGQKPWLPRRLQRREIPPDFFEKVVSFSLRFVRLMESFLRPRWVRLFTTPGILRLHGILILISALVLLLPLPIPFTNAFPAWAIILTAAGLLERDGLFVVLGYLAFCVGLLYFIFLGEAARQLLDLFLSWLSS